MCLTKTQFLVSLGVSLATSVVTCTDLTPIVFGCVGSSPYCRYLTVVPCQNGVCVAWSTAFPTTPAPQCSNAPPVTAGNVSITITQGDWANCAVSNDDSDQCWETENTCATYVLYDADDDECTNPCPLPYSIQYCEEWRSAGRLSLMTARV